MNIARAIRRMKIQSDILADRLEQIVNGYDRTVDNRLEFYMRRFELENKDD